MQFTHKQNKSFKKPNMVSKVTQKKPLIMQSLQTLKWGALTLVYASWRGVSGTTGNPYR